MSIRGVIEKQTQNNYSVCMDAFTILMPALTLMAIAVGACLTVLVLAALGGKFFGGFLK